MWKQIVSRVMFCSQVALPRIRRKSVITNRKSAGFEEMGRIQERAGSPGKCYVSVPFEQEQVQGGTETWSHS